MDSGVNYGWILLWMLTWILLRSGVGYGMDSGVDSGMDLGVTSFALACVGLVISVWFEIY